MTTTAEMTISAFSDALAAKQSTPGGGGAAAITGSLAAALLSMVINFTLGRKKYAAVEAKMGEYLFRSEQVRATLLKLADSDVEAFGAVSACYTMPRETDAEKLARDAAMQHALKGATQVPFTIAQACLEVMQLAQPVATDGNANVVSDAATALHLANAGLHSALVNVNINLKYIQDAEFVSEWSAKRDALLAKATTAHDAAKIACESTLGVGI